MRIGLDLDHTVCGFPEFFREFIEAMQDRGHTIVITSARGVHRWPSYKRYLESLGFTGLDEVDLSVMGRRGPKGKGTAADDCDIVFDDGADVINPHTKTPVFKCPPEKAAVPEIPR